MVDTERPPIDSPDQFNLLTSDEQHALLDWIRTTLQPAARKLDFSSYGMKHDFEHTPRGFYVTNGAFKGAMRAAGFEPVDESAQNWIFRVKRYPEMGRGT